MSNITQLLFLVFSKNIFRPVVWRSVLVKIKKIFSLLIELFVLAVYFILLYIYIVTFCRAFFSLPSMNFWHILQIFFFYNVRIIFGTLSE